MEGRRSLKCKGCDFATDRKDHLKKHTRVSHVEDEVQCQFCTCTFRNIRSLLNHTQGVHPKMSTCPDCNSSIRYFVQLSTITVGEGNRSSLGCPICPYIVIKSKVSLQEDPVESKKLTSTSRRFLEAEQKPKKDKTTRTLEEAQTSLEQVKGASPLKCMECEFTTMYYCDVVLHKERSHVKNGVQCSMCPYSFRNNQGLRAHVGKTHRSVSRGSDSSVKPTETNLVNDADSVRPPAATHIRNTRRHRIHSIATPAQLTSNNSSIPDTHTASSSSNFESSGDDECLQDTSSQLEEQSFAKRRVVWDEQVTKKHKILRSSDPKLNEKNLLKVITAQSHLISLRNTQMGLLTTQLLRKEDADKPTRRSSRILTHK